MRRILSITLGILLCEVAVGASATDGTNGLELVRSPARRTGIRLG